MPQMINRPGDGHDGFCVVVVDTLSDGRVLVQAVKTPPPGCHKLTPPVNLATPYRPEELVDCTCP